MKKTTWMAAAGLAVVLGACDGAKKGAETEDAATNPFFTEYTTPFGVPPFEQIKVEHYKPAFLKGMEEQSEEVKAIVENADEPTFENTVAALDRSGELLTKVMYAFYGQSSINSNDEIQALEQELSPLLSKHSDDINLNPKLFERVKVVYENQAKFKLDKEQKRLLEETYKGFVRNGANLDADKQAELRKLNEQISLLELTFAQNVLKETNAYQLVIDKKEDLSGLPEGVIAAAAASAGWWRASPCPPWRRRSRKACFRFCINKSMFLLFTHLIRLLVRFLLAQHMAVEEMHDAVGIAVRRLVDRVVDDLPQNMMQSLDARRADIHARTKPDRVEPFEYFQIFRRVFFLSHKTPKFPQLAL